ncbi:ricin-type beta-trefoil lectin domain protein [Streptomyces sp. NBC_01262]|uniref:ricin-type beta-trefoil lectin domain protein n=1 Tax=Streptomyces sp. NBC_01262 TaxID=2903803 RepID=UPI002E34ABDB|nr:ricin-type beta-trefoil lectin domain protein [Streptomyces sp. NBC_01262]
MTASPDDPTAAAGEASPLPRRTQKSSAIADASSGANAKRAANKGGPAGTASARRAAAVPAVPAPRSGSGSGESEGAAGSTDAFADGFAAGLAFAPLHGAGQNPLAAGADGTATGSRPGQSGGNRPPRRRRKLLLAGGAVLGALLIGIPLFLLLGRGAGDDSKDASAPVVAPGEEPDPIATGASVFNSLSPSADSSSSPLQSPTGSPSASVSTTGSASPGDGTETAGGSVVQATSSTSATTDSGDRAGGVTIVSYGSGRCIDVSGGSSSDGARLEIMDCTGAARQTWKFMTDGTVRAMGKCMDVNGGSREDTAWIQLVTCNGTGAQQFVLNSSHDLVNIQADKCVDVTDGATANGAYLQQWTCTGGQNQKWHTA